MGWIETTDPEIKVEITLSRSREKKMTEWNEECYALKRGTKKALRRWKNQKIALEEFLKVGETYRSKCKERK